MLNENSEKQMLQVGNKLVMLTSVMFTVWLVELYSMYTVNMKTDMNESIYNSLFLFMS